MKQVFNNDMVAHVWANQTQETGRNSSSTFYFSGTTIYSYGPHFPAAKIYGKENAVLVNSDTYSPTTGQHLSKIRSAINDSRYTVFYVPDVTDPDSRENREYFLDNMSESLASVFKLTRSVKEHIAAFNSWLCKANDFSDHFELNWELPNSSDFYEYFKEVEQFRDERVSQLAEKNKAKRERQRKEILNTHWIKVFKDDYISLDGDENVPMSHRLESARFIPQEFGDLLSFDELERVRLKFVELKETHSLVIGRIVADGSLSTLTKLDQVAGFEDIYTDIYQNLLEQHLDNWRKREVDTDGYIKKISGQHDLIRINGATVETSGHAEVPLSHALRLYALLKKGQAREGHRIGHFTLEMIEQGVVRIGCHRIKISEADIVLGPLLAKCTEYKDWPETIFYTQGAVLGNLSPDTLRTMRDFIRTNRELLDGL